MEHQEPSEIEVSEFSVGIFLICCTISFVFLMSEEYDFAVLAMIPSVWLLFWESPYAGVDDFVAAVVLLAIGLFIDSMANSFACSICCSVPLIVAIWKSSYPPNTNSTKVQVQSLQTNQVRKKKVINAKEREKSLQQSAKNAAKLESAMSKIGQPIKNPKTPQRMKGLFVHSKDGLELDFGRHRGLTLSEVLDIDPRYLIWLRSPQSPLHNRYIPEFDAFLDSEVTAILDSEKEKMDEEINERKRKKQKQQKRIKKDVEALSEALENLDFKGITKKITNVSKHPKQNLEGFGYKYPGIRRTGSKSEIETSIKNIVGVWSTQIDEIESYNKRVNKKSTSDELKEIKKQISPYTSSRNRDAHPIIRKKAISLKKRCDSWLIKAITREEEEKQHRDREMKMQAFSRQMIQTTNVPNATLTRKEKSWKKSEGKCTRPTCKSPSSSVAFYWDIFPELELVLVCDECAAKEEFVHAEDSIGNDDDDLGDAFLTSLG